MTRRSEAVRTAELTYTALLEPAEEGGYIVSFPAFPGIVTQGETQGEARAMAADLLTGYLALLRERGRPLPASDASPSTPIRAPLAVKLTTA